MHPAVEFLKIIGNGPRSSRDFTQEEAGRLIRALFDDVFTESQLGALFLMMRRKSETRDEMIGFVNAWEALFPALQPMPDSLMVGAPFDGKKRTILMTPMAMLILTQAGYSIYAGGTQGLGPKHGITIMEVTDNILQQARFSGLTRPNIWNPSEFFPIYERWKKVRNEVGLRGFLHTVEKYLNPYKSNHCLMSIHHTPYMDLFLGSSEGRGRQITVTKGDEGSPDLHTKHNTVYTVLRDGKEEEGKVLLEEFGLTPVDYCGDTSPASVLRFWTQAITVPDSMEARWLVAQSALLLFAAGQGATPMANRNLALAALDATRKRCN